MNMKISNLLMTLGISAVGFSACNDLQNTMLPVFTETVEFENTGIVFSENADTVQIPVILSGFAKNDVQLTVAVYREKEMLAREDTNFFLPVKTITIPKGGSTGSIPLIIENDNEVNVNRSFRLQITKIDGAEPARISQLCKVTLVNEDFWPEVQFANSSFSLTEHETRLVIPVIALGIFYEPMDVNVKVTNGTAVEETNFSLSKTSFNFTKSQLDSIVVTIPVQDINEDLSFNLNMEVLNGGLAGKIKSTKVTIKDVRKIVGFANSETPVLANAKTISIPLVISGMRSSRDLIAEIMVKDAGGLVEGTDFTLTDNPLVTKGDTTLYVKLNLADGVSLPTTPILLEVKKVTDGEISETLGITTLKITAGGKIDPIIKPWEMLQWTSEEPTGDGGCPAKNLIDGNIDKFWHSRWQTGKDPAPFILEFDMKEKIEIEKIGLYRRQLANKDAKEVTVEISPDRTVWGTPHKYVFDAAGVTLIKNGLEKQLPVSETGRYVRVTVTTCTGQNTASLAEIVIWGFPRK